MIQNNLFKEKKHTKGTHYLLDTSQDKKPKKVLFIKEEMWCISNTNLFSKHQILNNQPGYHSAMSKPPLPRLAPVPPLLLTPPSQLAATLSTWWLQKHVILIPRFQPPSPFNQTKVLIILVFLLLLFYFFWLRCTTCRVFPDQDYTEATAVKAQNPSH